MKLKIKENLKTGAQGLLWTGGAYLATDKATNYLAESFPAVQEFVSKGPWYEAGVKLGTGLLLTGLISGALAAGKKGAAARKAGAAMAVGVMLSVVGKIASSKVNEITMPGGDARRYIRSGRPAAGVLPQNAMLRAGGGIVMGSPAQGADQAVMGLGTPGGRYINPNFRWPSIREL